MGYRIDIKLDKEINDFMIDKIVEFLPNEYVIGGKQPWGWSCASDMRLSGSHTITISGSCSMSGQIVDRFMVHFIQLLTVEGYFVQIGEWNI